MSTFPVFLVNFSLQKGIVLQKVQSLSHCDSIYLPAFIEMLSKTCLKNHFYNLHAPICSIFYLHSVDVVRYVTIIQEKSPTNCKAYLTESIFQTHSSTLIYMYIFHIYIHNIVIGISPTIQSRSIHFFVFLLQGK